MQPAQPFDKALSPKFQRIVRAAHVAAEGRNAPKCAVIADIYGERGGGRSGGEQVVERGGGRIRKARVVKQRHETAAERQAVQRLAILEGGERRKAIAQRGGRVKKRAQVLEHAALTEFFELRVGKQRDIRAAGVIGGGEPLAQLVGRRERGLNLNIRTHLRELRDEVAQRVCLRFRPTVPENNLSGASAGVRRSERIHRKAVGFVDEIRKNFGGGARRNSLPQRLLIRRAAPRENRADLRDNRRHGGGAGLLQKSGNRRMRRRIHVDVGRNLIRPLHQRGLAFDFGQIFGEFNRQLRLRGG